MELFSPDLRIDFLSKAKYAFVFSLLMLAASVYFWVSSGTSKYGIDFLGGHEFIVRFEGDVKVDAIRSALDGGGVQNSVVQAFEGSNEFSIRLGGGEGTVKEVSDKVSGTLKQSFGEKVEILKSDYVGPAVGAELRNQAAVALMVGLIGILAYIAFRFEMAYAIGAVVALFHDVIVAIGIYLAAGYTVTMGTVAAALTIIGYSVNDTIVIFDRVREERRRRKGTGLAEILNESVSVTLSRTIITSLLTLFSALALLLIGGGSISDLSLFLVAGVITGSYSTIYIASPAALAWERYKKREAA
ncbi:MAG: protein translocase subunit SecF [Deltaproteobacteria bacterium]|nr:protein translocase subunit SecF [Deltaproteobacteria bacterium]